MLLGCMLLGCMLLPQTKPVCCIDYKTNEKGNCYSWGRARYCILNYKGKREQHLRPFWNKYFPPFLKTRMGGEGEEFPVMLQMSCFTHDICQSASCQYPQ